MIKFADDVTRPKRWLLTSEGQGRDHSPLHIHGSTVEIVKGTKFLGVHLAEDLTWSLNTRTITKKAQQCLYLLRRLRKAHLPPPILTTFYRGTIESILSSCITAWFGNCTASDRKGTSAENSDECSDTSEELSNQSEESKEMSDYSERSEEMSDQSEGSEELSYHSAGSEELSDHSEGSKGCLITVEGVRSCLITVKGVRSCLITVKGVRSCLITVKGVRSCLITVKGVRRCLITVEGARSCLITVKDTLLCLHFKQAKVFHLIQHLSY
ncbi:hypothetical protein NFI96_006850 [Prochilodus magdalenae]|nr:hypothetical protein NFI96_006850 [Prochilodus magdalenae]